MPFTIKGRAGFLSHSYWWEGDLNTPRFQTQAQLEYACVIAFLLKDGNSGIRFSIHGD